MTAQLPVLANAPDSRFYVSAIDGPKWWPMVGPFRSHANALAIVDRARQLANDLDPRGAWTGYGTAQYVDGSLIGKLNGYFGEELRKDVENADAY